MNIDFENERCEIPEVHGELLAIISRKMPADEKIFDLAELFKMFGDSTRMKILFVLFEAGVCTCDLAEALGVSYYTITDWVKGKTIPRMDKLEKLAKYFNVKISDLVEKKSIENNPVEIAEIHAEILMDEEYVNMYESFKLLDETQRKIVKDLVRSLAATKTVVFR